MLKKKKTKGVAFFAVVYVVVDVVCVCVCVCVCVGNHEDDVGSVTFFSLSNHRADTKCDHSPVLVGRQAPDPNEVHKETNGIRSHRNNKNNHHHRFFFSFR